MRRGVWIRAVVLLVGSCARQVPKHFTHEVLNRMTPIKDQGDSETCWIYAMLAAIETEHLRIGDSVNLSPAFIEQKLSEEPQAPESKRGMGATLLELIQRHGIVGYDVMPDDATPDLPLPKWVFMLGAKYTPQEFAHSVCAPDEYLSLTCWPDSPYYQKVDVPVPDNWEHNRLVSVPLDTLKAHVDQARHHRHPVCWESRGHAMEVVGMAHDEQQRHYYVMKNSWGSDDPYKGLVYMPVSKMWEDMIAIYMTKTAYEQ